MSSLGIIFSNIHDNCVPELTRNRTMASIPFGGRYRIIDFMLSNMINSDITTVGVITKNNYQSLMDHVGSGKDWDLARKNGGLIILPPYGASSSDSLYTSRLDALKGILSFLTKATQEYVLMTDCDIVCNMDYSKIIDYHIEKKADFTVAYKSIKDKSENLQDSAFISFDESGRINSISYKQEEIGSQLLNIYVVGRQFLINLVKDAVAHGYKHFTREILSDNVNSLKIFGYEYKGYTSKIYDMQSYYQSNMNLLDKTIRDELFAQRNVYTKVRDSSPSKYGGSAQVKNSLISDGCIIEGEVINSVLFRGVKVGRGTVVKDSILMQDTVTGDNTSLTAVITDKNVVIRDGRMLAGCDLRPYFIPKGNMI